MVLESQFKVSSVSMELIVFLCLIILVIILMVRIVNILNYRVSQNIRSLECVFLLNIINFCWISVVKELFFDQRMIACDVDNGILNILLSRFFLAVIWILTLRWKSYWLITSSSIIFIPGAGNDISNELRYNYWSSLGGPHNTFKYFKYTGYFENHFV